MINIISFSGGKDSTALILWAQENLDSFVTVFCDTGWEHPINYAYIKEINESLLDSKLITLKSKVYDGFEDLVIKRKMVPGVQGKFCTQELKIFPTWDYIRSLDDEATLYQGIRADESLRRSKYTESQWTDEAGGYLMMRPLLRWSADEVFEYLKSHGVKPNPLYLLGAKRVGCFPCVHVSHRELKALLKATPGLRQRLVDLERKLNAAYEFNNYSSFFRGDDIPELFCSVTVLKDCDACNNTGIVEAITLTVGLFEGQPERKFNVRCEKCKGKGKRLAKVP